MILKKTLMATTALMISFQPAAASMLANDSGRMVIVAQGAESAQILNEAMAELEAATQALAAAKESGEGVEEAQQAFDAAQARVGQAQAEFDAAQEAQEAVPEPEMEAPAPEAEAPAPEAAPEAEVPAAEPELAPEAEAAPDAAEEPAPEMEAEPAPEAGVDAEADVEAETDAEVEVPAVEEAAPEAEATEEAAPESPAAEEAAPDAAEEPAPEAGVDAEADVEAETDAEVEVPAAEEAAPEAEATEEPAPEAPAAEDTAPEAEGEAMPEAPEGSEEAPAQGEAAPEAEEQPADGDAAEGQSEGEETDGNSDRVEVTEPDMEAEPVEEIIQETRQAPATVLPENVSEQQRAALERAEQQRREDSRQRRNELIGAAAVGVAVGALVPLLGGKLVEDQGDRVIIERNGEYFVRKDENALLRRDGVTVDYEELRNGLSRETMTRPNGVQIVTTRAPNGDILRRERIRRDGSVVVLIDSMDRGNVEYVDYDRELPPLNLTIDRGLYVVDARDANQERLRETFFAPPVEEVRQEYTLREVRSSERLRDSVRRVDLDNIEFDTGSATVRQSQVQFLEQAALAMADVINEDPTAVFLIEGHTDAVGGEVYNLALSDRRAETVARILTTNYGLPPENFVVEGYGEADLKVDTQSDEPRNRRVAIRNITQLISASN